MAGNATTQAPTRGRQSVFQVARELYGAAFEPKSRTKVGEAMADWAELSEAEQSFTLGHLLYLNLYAQASTLNVLREIRDAVQAVDDAVQTLADDTGDEAGDDEEPPADEDASMQESFDDAPGLDEGEATSLQALVAEPPQTSTETEVSHVGG